MESYDTKKIFSENLKRILLKYGMTQSELAEEMGVAYSSVSSWRIGLVKRIKNFRHRC